MLVFFARSGARHPALPVALGLLIGGSVSNLVDRVRLGYVTDFLDLRWWPAFNLADASIVVGVAVLLGSLLLADGNPRRRADALGGPSLIRVRVPADAAGLRLDRFLAGLDEVGSRAAAERLLDAGERARRRDRARQVVPPRGGPGRSSSSRRRAAPLVARAARPPHRLRGRAPARRGQARGRRRPSRRRATRPGTLVHALLGRDGGRRRARAAGDRPPARPRHVRPDGRRADGGGLPPAAVARPPPPARAGVPRARPRAAALAERADRGRDRARPLRADAPVARHGHARATPSRTSRSSSSSRQHALLRVRLETGRTHQIRVHLAAIDLPVVGDRVYGVPRPRARAPVPARRAARVPAPDHGRAGRDGVAAPARPRRRARARPRRLASGRRCYPWRLLSPDPAADASRGGAGAQCSTEPVPLGRRRL